ncbi:ALP1-like protein, partial [Tanacetum coccineum]
KEGISPLLKCTSAIRQLTCDINADFLDEYLQMCERSSRLSLDHICSSVMEIFGPEYLRKPTWFGCPNAFKGKYVRCDHVLNPFILLEDVVSDLKIERASKIPFVANDVTYPCGYYLLDGIHPEFATLAKTIQELVDDDNKRILYKLKQKSARKDVERTFDVLKKK